MSRFLDSKLTLRHLLVLGVLVLTLAIAGSAIAAQPNALPLGTIHLASASSNAAFNASGSNNPPKKAISVGFVVPSKGVAEIQTTFSAVVIHNVGPGGVYAYCFAYFTLDSATASSPVFHPGQYQLIGGRQVNEPDAFTASMTGWRTGIGSGQHYVNVYISSAYDGCQLQERALNVVINLH